MATLLDSTEILRAKMKLLGLQVAMSTAALEKGFACRAWALSIDFADARPLILLVLP